jgi:hypothetical protein
MAGGAVQGMRLADTIAARAHRNYLVAAMAAVPLSVADQLVDPQTADFDPSRIPSGVGEALSKYLEQLPGQQQSRTRALLTPERVTEFLATPGYPSAADAAPEPPVIPDCGTGRVKEVTMTRRKGFGSRRC